MPPVVPVAMGLVLTVPEIVAPVVTVPEIVVPVVTVPEDVGPVVTVLVVTSVTAVPVRTCRTRRCPSGCAR